MSAQQPTSIALPAVDPRRCLTDLFQVAVARAMPLYSMAAHLPPPPSDGGRTVVLGDRKSTRLNSSHH